MLRKEHLTYPGYQYWTTSLLDFNIYHLGSFALVHLKNLCSTFFFFGFTWKPQHSGGGDWLQSLSYLCAITCSMHQQGVRAHGSVRASLQLRGCSAKNPQQDRRADLAASAAVQALLWQRCWCSPALRWTRSQLTGPTQAPLIHYTDFCHFSCVRFYI